MTARKRPEDKLKAGAPTTYTPELAAYICHKIATHPHGIRKLHKLDKKFPDHTTIADWLVRHPEFATLYNNARRYRTDLQVEQLLDVVDDLEIKEFTDEKGITRLDGGIVSACKLNVDTRKWIASKLLPKTYGDKTEIDELKGQNENMMKELLALRAELAVKNKKEY